MFNAACVVQNSCKLRCGLLLFFQMLLMCNTEVTIFEGNKMRAWMKKLLPNWVKQMVSKVKEEIKVITWS